MRYSIIQISIQTNIFIIFPLQIRCIILINLVSKQKGSVGCKKSTYNITLICLHFLRTITVYICIRTFQLCLNCFQYGFFSGSKVLAYLHFRTSCILFSKMIGIQDFIFKKGIVHISNRNHNVTIISHLISVVLHYILYLFQQNTSQLLL